ncbi:GNAT family N-acetyltransferase [Pseudosporangium ferrugineum]|uniref:Acetyltransferase (GNAT) family protein n=1 Tax=Pseudosporangium ferrugineum TaxID=439699 RepID=A0A2T0S267_9ACTN|nr:GNAT family N-acetyltransferase [Pseudosporangium ferrugineum]PRY27516.1 acetyltransferase (GNAT) family protein [Pseudosporangium ferrugineum]
MIEARQGGPADAPELMRLRKVMIDSAGGEPAPAGEWQDAGIAILGERLGDPAGPLAAFVVDRPDGPGLAACVVGAIDRRLPSPDNPGGLRGYVYNVATDPGYRRRGYSRACMTALIAWYARRGVDVIGLRASPDGEPLYASLGFRRTKDPAMRLVIPGR